jgi:hypothetical protein
MVQYSTSEREVQEPCAAVLAPRLPSGGRGARSSPAHATPANFRTCAYLSNVIWMDECPICRESIFTLTFLESASVAKRVHIVTAHEAPRRSLALPCSDLGALQSPHVVALKEFVGVQEPTARGEPHQRRPHQRADRARGRDVGGLRRRCAATTDVAAPHPEGDATKPASEGVVPEDLRDFWTLTFGRRRAVGSGTRLACAPEAALDRVIRSAFASSFGVGGRT